jgi:hypothetical protein
MRVAAALGTRIASFRVRRSAVIPVFLGGLLGCGGSGRLELVLDLPEGDDLRPAGMTTVTVIAQPFEDDPVATTSVISNNRFEAGELPAGEPVSLQVALRDGTGRLVGYGQALEPIELSADSLTRVRIAVRRPFLYATSSAGPTNGLFTFDPTSTPIDQGRLAPAAPIRAVPVGGDQLAVISGSSVEMIATEDHMVEGSSIALPAAATDAAQVPGERRIVVGLATGMAVVDLDSGAVDMIPGGAVSRVTVGVLDDGSRIAYGLIDRVAPPEINEACAAGTSSLLRVDLAAPEAPSTAALGIGLADVAAGVDAPALYGAAPCLGQVVSFDGEQATNVFALPRAAQVAIQGTRAWAVGTQPAEIMLSGGEPDYVIADAIQIVGSIDTRGGSAVTFALPHQRQQMNDTTDPAIEHAQVMKPMSALPLDMVVLAGGEFIAIATKYQFHSNQLIYNTPFGPLIALPEMDVTTADVVVIAGATSVLTHRVRTTCTLDNIGPADIFPSWGCALPEAGQAPEPGAYQAAALGALFGAR